MKTALIIEDNLDNMTLICDILDLAGYKTIHAENGLRGIEMAQENNPDFIILDIQLPDINGYEVLDRIRANDKTRSIPVIAMTSFAMAGDKERLLNAGCDGYIEKPIDPDMVIDYIHQSVWGSK